MASGGGGGGWADTEPETCQASGDRTMPGRSLDMCANCGCRGMYDGICGEGEKGRKEGRAVSQLSFVKEQPEVLYSLAAGSRRDSAPPG